MNNDSNVVTEIEHEAPMKDGNLTILYTKETRSYLRPALYPQSTQSNKATEQQSALQVT
jgi:hypothetical protein